MKTLLLDCNYIGHRAIYTMEHLSVQNESTGVVYGFLLQMKNLAEKFRTNDIVFCWDSKSSKRRELYPEYKSARQKVDDETKRKREDGYRQFELLRTEIIPSMGFVNNFYQEGYESDDLMANIVMDWERDFMMVTADNDMFQILDWTDMYSPATDKIYTYDSFMEEWGITPELWATVKALAGCTSDNVIGLPKVGNKTAIKYINKTLKPSTKAYKEIESRWHEMMGQNLKLVRLPFEGTKTCYLKKNKLEYNGLLSAAHRFEFTSFLNDNAASMEWKEFFNPLNYTG